MSAVLDSSALVAALTDAKADGEWARAIVAKGDLYAPELILAETSNLLRRLEIAGAVAGADANAAQAELMQMQIALLGYRSFATRIWDLRGALTAYDAWNVAIAEAVGFPLVTLDVRLSRARGPRCRFLTP